MIKKQRVLIITLAVCFVVMLAAYFAVVRPLTERTEETDEPLSTVPGELIDGGGTMYRMFPQIESGNIQSIEVHNESGSFTFSYSKTTGDFVLDGFDGIPYDKQKFSEMVASAGGGVAMDKITDDATEEQLTQYGFTGDDKCQAYYTLTTRTGEKRTVRYGYKLVTGGAYYAMFEGRNTIYVVSSTVGDTLLAPVENMITPLLTAGVDVASSMYIDNFTIKRGGEDFLVCRNKTKEELALEGSSAMAEAVTVTPAGGYLMSMDYSSVLQSLATFQGESVVAVGLTEENFEEYGLSDSPYEISYEYDGFKFKLTVSEPVDGYCYVASNMFGIIAKVPEASLDFLKWEYLNWISPQFVTSNIKTVDKISVTFDGVDEVFDLTHFPNDENRLSVIGKNCGEVSDVTSFRNFYMKLLASRVMGYAPEDIDVNDYDCMLRFTLTFEAVPGEEPVENEYAFYQYSTGRCYMTVNGEGEFYVYDDTVNDMIDSVTNIINREPVDSPI